MKNIHYINHTHWDREWLRSSDTYRIRAVYVFDMLLDILDRNEDYKYFTFDGQTAALEDYLTIRPEKRDKIRKYVSEKRIFIGPWYTQPDLALVSGESLLRNLIIGSNIAKDLGHCMTSGWIPDAFGQIQTTPQIFKELGMKSLFVWRGFNYEYTKDSVFLWEAPNGDSILSIHFPLGYGYYRYLPTDKEAAFKDLKGFKDKVEDRFVDDEILLMGGSDHTKPQESITETIKNLKTNFLDEGYNIKISNPEIYTEDVIKSINKSKRKLEIFKGEARSAMLGRIHAGITSTRVDIKNQMKKYETMLPLTVEPMSVISTTIGGRFDQSITNYYWKTIFKNQFHDSIYSSSPNSINKTVENRLLNLRHGLNELIWMNIRSLKDKLDFSNFKENEDAAVLFNTLPYKRDDLIFINFIVKDKDFILKDDKGNIIPYVIVKDKKEINTEIEEYNGCVNYHDAGEILEGTKFNIQVKIKASIMPPMGYKVLKVCYGEKQDEEAFENTDLELLEDKLFQNKFLKVKINENGTIDILNKENGELYKEVHWFEEGGDDGDEYNYSPPVIDKVIDTKSLKPKIEMLENNLYEIKYKITYNLNTPIECIDHKRSEDEVMSVIVSYISLKEKSKTVDFKTVIKNNAKDHIIKAIFTDTESSKESLAQDHFGTIVRNNEILNQAGLENGATEEELPIYPFQKFVKLNNTNNTFAVLSKGPCEYMIYNNRKIALTVLRSVGKLGKADLVVRPGRSSGYRLDAKDSQLLKSVESEYSIFIDSGKANISNLFREANKLNVQVQSRHLNIFTREKHEMKPFETSILEIEEGFEIIAFKKSEDNKGYVIRILNPNKFNLENKKIKIDFNIKNAYLSTLKEEKVQKLDFNNGVLKLPSINKESFITLYLE